MVGPDDLKGPFQPKQSYDSVIMHQPCHSLKTGLQTRKRRLNPEHGPSKMEMFWEEEEMMNKCLTYFCKVLVYF